MLFLEGQLSTAKELYAEITTNELAAMKVVTNEPKSSRTPQWSGRTPSWAADTAQASSSQPHHVCLQLYSSGTANLRMQNADDEWLASLPDHVLFAGVPGHDGALAGKDATALAGEKATSCSGSSTSSAWGSLRPPTARDVKGHSSGRKGLSAAPEAMSHLVVLDFEWTADNKRAMLPCSEITQFPSVLVRLDGRRSHVVDEFDSFVRPTFNPTLTRFSIELTAISQLDVDGSDPIVEVLPRYLAWLRGHGLVDDDGHRKGKWSFCTWSDADIGGQLSRELRHKQISMPPCFDEWIDLKVHYLRRYRVEPRGGLRACVERLGLCFTGRAHNGLVDCQNTAKIVLHMARGDGMYGPATVFLHSTRGLDANGHAFGSRASREARHDNADRRATGASTDQPLGSGTQGPAKRVRR